MCGSSAGTTGKPFGDSTNDGSKLNAAIKTAVEAADGAGTAATCTKKAVTDAESAKTAADKTLGEKKTAHAEKLADILTNAVVTVFTTDANFTTPAKKLSEAHANAQAIVNAIAKQEADLLAYVEANLKDGATAGTPTKENAKKAIAKAVELAKAGANDTVLSDAGVGSGKPFGDSTNDGSKLNAAVKTAAEGAYGTAFDGAGGTKKDITKAETELTTKKAELTTKEAALTEAVAKKDAKAVESAQKAAGTSKNLCTF